jgi:hypothetical protein
MPAMQSANRGVSEKCTFKFSHLTNVRSYDHAHEIHRIDATYENGMLMSVLVVRPFSFDRHRRLQMGGHKSFETDRDIPAFSGPLAQEHQAILTDVNRDLLAASKSRRDGGNGWSTAKATNGTSLAPASSYSHDIFSPVKPTDSQPYPARATVDIPFERSSILTNRPSFPAPFKTGRSIAQPPMSAPSLPASLQLARTLTRPSVSEDRPKMVTRPARLPTPEEPTEQPTFVLRGTRGTERPIDELGYRIADTPFEDIPNERPTADPVDRVSIKKGMLTTRSCPACQC